MISAAQARAILAAEWEALTGSPPPWRALRLVMAQSLTEGQWGDFGGYDAEGNYGGFNWGAVQSKFGPPCPSGTFQHGDSKPTANGQVSFVWCFLAYPTIEAGARDFLRHAIILRPKAYEAALSGDARWFAEELRASNYYHGFSTTKGEGPEADAARWNEQVTGYETMLNHNAAKIDAWLGLQPPVIAKRPVKPGLTKAKKRSAGPLAALALAASAIFAINRY